MCITCYKGNGISRDNICQNNVFKDIFANAFMDFLVFNGNIGFFKIYFSQINGY
jgi:hypothetical protein